MENGIINRIIVNLAGDGTWIPESQKEWHDWLKKNHAKAKEFQIGFYKVKAKKLGITDEEALDEALCFGWIDGVGEWSG